MKKVLLLIGIIFFLTGCSHLLDNLDLHDETIYPPAFPADIPPPPKTTGTIYQSGYQLELYRDHIASRIGDIITIRLEEQTQGQKQADTKTSKADTIDTNLGTLAKPTFFGGGFRPAIFNLGSDMQFTGKGEMNQNNKLQGTISVTVLRVLSNGNLVIQGETWITLNQGREYIRITGIIRPEDIEPNNTISSQRVADARIAYSGSGQVGNASRAGFFTQLMYKFFPF